MTRLSSISSLRSYIADSLLQKVSPSPNSSSLFNHQLRIDAISYKREQAFTSLNTGLVFRLHAISRKSKLSPLDISEWEQVVALLRGKSFQVDFKKSELLPNNSNESPNATTISLSASQSILVVLQSVLANRTRYGFESPMHSHVSFADHKSGGKGAARPRLVFEHSPSQLVAIDFSSPNIAKPFHAGHLRSTLVGAFISNINRAFGHRVQTYNFLGDWGLQIGKLILGFQRYGAEEKLLTQPIDHLFEIYVKIHKDLASSEASPAVTGTGTGEKSASESPEEARARRLFEQLETGDAHLHALWTRIRELSLHELRESYQRLNIAFDVMDSESTHAHNARQLVAALLQRGLASQPSPDGPVLLKLGDKNTTPLLKSDGSTLYLSRDLAAAVARYERQRYDRAHYVVDSAQAAHFRAVRAALQAADYSPAANIVAPWPFHVPFGRVQGMSSRLGNVLLLRHIIASTTELIKRSLLDTKTTKVSTSDEEAVAEVAARLTQSVLAVEVHRHARARDITLDRLSFAGDAADSALHLQYCHARLASLERECERVGLRIDAALLADERLLQRAFLADEATAAVVMELVAALASFDQVLNECFALYEPQKLHLYCAQLTGCINQLYRSVRVLNPEIPSEVASVRAVMFFCSRLVLQNALTILFGCPPVDRM